MQPQKHRALIYTCFCIVISMETELPPTFLLLSLGLSELSIIISVILSSPDALLHVRHVKRVFSFLKSEGFLFF